MKKYFVPFIICLLLIIIACKDKAMDDSAHASSTIRSPEISQLTMYLEKEPNDASLWHGRGTLYYELEDYEQAISDLEKSIALDPSNLDARHLLADAYLDNLQSRNALECMQNTCALFPDSTRSLLKLSEYQLILRQYNDALETLRQVQEKDNLNADAFFMKGMVLKEVGDTTGSITQFQQATKANPRLIDAWINLGQLFESQKDADAIRYLDAGLSVSPGHLILLHAKAQYLGRKEDFEAAKKVYLSMIDIDPMDANVYYDLGLLYLEQDSVLKARNHFDLCLKIDPMISRAYFYRGITSEMAGQIESAEKDYQQTLQINQNDQDAKDALERLQTEKG